MKSPPVEPASGRRHTSGIEMDLDLKALKAYTSIFVIAETASSHEGDLNLAMKMAEAVAGTGANAIKYQMFKADSLLVPSHHKYESFKDLEFSEEEWRQIIAHARSLGLFVIAEVFDEYSFRLSEQVEIAAYKVPTSDLTNQRFLSEMASTQKPIIISVGAATESEIEFAVRTCEKAGNSTIILMHGFQNFPTKIEDTNFRLLNYLKNKFTYPVGFADHVDAESELALFMPLVAIAFGANVVEKHITLDRSQKGRDYYSALNPDEFQNMISLIREIEKAYGTSEFGFSPAELVYRQLMKKMVVAAHDIAEGDRIDESALIFRRTDEAGLNPSEYKKLMGLAKRSIIRHEVVKKEDIA